MLSFESDYIQGAHEKILERLAKTNREPLSGYGNDKYCESAKEKIRQACGCEEAEIFFLTGGTQTNQIVISSMLKSYEGVAAAETGHVSVHEAGAIEHSGHKVLTIPGHEGKIKAEELAAYLKAYWEDSSHEHMVFPGMVYISHPTEYGTLYTERELADIAGVCGEYSIPLYLDGARLGYGLMSRETDVTLAKIAKYCDVFYIGGTKCGALFGEALVITRPELNENIMFNRKQKGAVTAKGRLLGIQFEELFREDLYIKAGEISNKMALRIRDAIAKEGFGFLIESVTNQQFPILPKKLLEELGKKYEYTFWQPHNQEYDVVRLVTSWATTEEQVDAFIHDFKEAAKAYK